MRVRKRAVYWSDADWYIDHELCGATEFLQRTFKRTECKSVQRIRLSAGPDLADEPRERVPA